MGTDESKIREILEHNGFTQNEVDFYIALLASNGANAAEVAAQMGMDKASAYRAAQSLEEKGLVSSNANVYGKKLYAEDLGILKALLTKKKVEADKEITELETLMESLPLQLRGDHTRSQVKVLQGDQAVKRIYEERLEGNPPLIREVMSNNATGDLLPQDESYWNELIRKRIEQGTFLHMLIDEKDFDTTFHRSSEEQHKEVRILPEDFIITGGINIYTDTVAIHNRNTFHVMAIVIQDETIAELMRNFFDFVWRRSKII